MDIRLIVLAAFFALGCSDSSTPSSPEQGSVVTLEGVDFMGGDIKHLKAAGGTTECAKACADNPKCRAFTFAKADHPNAKKHNSCWLKKNGFKYNRSNHYVSGIKP